ncbi:unnamed protein product [Peniophora sp. CBMAI 1063]|nr:unnamed protein product [Peniophora sp. CBMAI 1063]
MEAIGYINTRSVLRLVVSAKLSPAQDLAGADFLKVFLNVALCHYTAWTTANVRHRDINLANIMCSTDTQGEKAGILIDWDLATFDEDHHDGLERTGTVPYMAMVLLEESTEGSIEHSYWHDLEALFWVLVWVTYPAGTFAPWESGTFAQCRNGKSGYLSAGPSTTRPKEKFQGVELLVYRLKTFFSEINDKRTRHLNYAAFLKGTGWAVPTFQEEAPQEIWKAFCKLLHDVIPFMDLPDQVVIGQVIKDFLVHADNF